MLRLQYIFTALILAFSLTVYAAEVTCYSDKTRIYHGYGRDFIFGEDFIAFTENQTNHVLLITGDCIIMTRLLQGEKFNAIDLRQESKIS